MSRSKLSLCSKADGLLVALREVAEYLAGQTLAVDVETVSFAMHFPRFFDAFRVSFGVGSLMKCGLENNSPVLIFQKRCVSLD